VLSLLIAVLSILLPRTTYFSCAVGWRSLQ
jgi:hypothetical protein